jgi:hypothetical protein
MTTPFRTPDLSVVDYWPLHGVLARTARPPRSDGPWKAHRYAGRLFSRLARRFGSSIKARNQPTYLTDPAQPKTAAAFAPLPAHLAPGFSAALVAAVGKRVPRLA